MENLEDLGKFLENLGDVFVEGEKPRLLYRGQVTRNLEPERGHRDRTYVFFVGIPYAMAPTGPRRFKPPEPYQTTKTKYDALTCKPLGKQYDNNTGNKTGSEDCLYLNIYLPKKPDTRHSLLPVLVYFHGGEMRQGSGNYRYVTPDSIMKEDIIFITVNYRLGVFGFLNMHWKFCQGNQGLKDQVMALEWIKDNIQKFGGNPRNVTICGQGSGGSCVNLHLISPLSKGLFHKAIVMSGGIHSPWGFTGHHRELMLNYKEAMGSANSSRDEVVDSMKKKDADDLLQIDRKMTEKKMMREIPIHLGASVENSPDGAFIPPCENIQELIDMADSVPILAGICTKEGYMIQEHDINWVKDEESFIRFLMDNLRWTRKSVAHRVNRILNPYFQGMSRMRDVDLRENMADLCTDLWFYNFFKNFEFRRHEKNELKPFYVYLFDFLDDTSASYKYLDKPEGAAHGDDLDYLFCSWETRKTAVAGKFPRNFQKKIRTMCKLWASFCNSAIPRADKVKWKPHTDDKPRYLYIGNEKIEMRNRQMFRARWGYLRDIIRLEPIIPSLPTTPLTPVRHEARHVDFEQALQAEPGLSLPTIIVTEEEIPNEQKSKSSEYGPAIDEDNRDQQIPQAPESGPGIDEDNRDQHMPPSSEPGPSVQSMEEL